MNLTSLPQKDKNLVKGASDLAMVLAESAPEEMVENVENWQRSHEDERASIKDYRGLFCALIENPRPTVFRSLTDDECSVLAKLAEVAMNVLNMPAFFVPTWLQGMGCMPGEDAA